jgi:hypothetical protein
MRKGLELLRVLKPGEEGTEELVAKYGDALVCVRYWYDAEHDVEVKIAEVVALRKPRPAVRRSPARACGVKRRGGKE